MNSAESQAIECMQKVNDLIKTFELNNPGIVILPYRTVSEAPCANDKGYARGLSKTVDYQLKFLSQI